MFSRLFFLIMIAALSSCNVGRKYQQPDVALPASFGEQQSADTTSIADVDWKKYVVDDNLKQLIDTAVRSNQDLLLAINRMDISRRRLTRARMLQLPGIDLQVAGQYNRPSENSLAGISANSFLGKSHIENYQVLLAVSWEADIWGRLRGQKEAAMAEYLQSAELSRAVQTQLVSDVSQGYFNLVMMDAQLEIARKNLLLSDSFLLATKMLKEAGIVSQVAVEQAESQKQLTALLVPQLEEDIAVQENGLQYLAGGYSGPVSRVNSFAERILSEEFSTGVPASLLSRRPDVRAAELALVAANARAGVARANMYPALNITAGTGLESFKSSNWFNIPGSLFAIAAGGIVQPVFRRGALKAEYDVALLEREQAVTRFRQQVLVAVTEVENALVRIQKLREQEYIVSAQVDTLEAASRNARLLFGSDMASYLEVVTAQGASLQAQLNLAAIRREYYAARIDLYRALGGGWR